MRAFIILTVFVFINALFFSCSTTVKQNKAQHASDEPIRYNTQGDFFREGRSRF